MKLLIFIGLAYLLQEDGYLYSVHTGKYLSYWISSGESKIFLVERGVRPMKFIMSELQGEYSGGLRLSPSQRYQRNMVLDRSGSDGSLIQFKEHNGENQVWKMELVPGLMVKLYVTNQCIEVKRSSPYLGAATCDHYEHAPGQYFRWIPTVVEKVISNAVGGYRRRGRPGSPGGPGNPGNYNGYPRDVNPNEIGIDRLPISDFDLQYRPGHGRDDCDDDWSRDRGGRRNGWPGAGPDGSRGGYGREYPPGDFWNDDCNGPYSCYSHKSNSRGEDRSPIDDDELLKNLLNFDRSISGNLFTV